MVKSATKDPKAPTLSMEPKRPLFTPKFAFNSGNLGTQAMMPTPKKKKRAFVSATSRLIKIVNSLDLFALESTLGRLDPPKKIASVNDPLREFSLHLRANGRNLTSD